MSKFRNFIKHAFAIKKETYEDLSNEDKRLIERLANGIVNRGLSVPSVMFLESIKPLSFLSSQTMLFFRPIVTAVFPISSYDRIESLLEKRQSIEWLIRVIEEYTSKKKTSYKDQDV